MGLNKPSGQMYWWAYTINFIAGTCEYACDYCYVKNKIAPWLRRMGNNKYYGKPRLMEHEFDTRLVVPDDYVIFVQSCGDLFGDWVPDHWIIRILNYCSEYSDTRFLFQTRNTGRLHDFRGYYPPDTILGTTVETNRYEPQLSRAPHTLQRIIFLQKMEGICPLMTSIEPVLNFDLKSMVEYHRVLKPEFVSIGADSGNNNLPEPPFWKLQKLITELESFTEVWLKKNLERLLK